MTSGPASLLFFLSFGEAGSFTKPVTYSLPMENSPRKWALLNGLGREEKARGKQRKRRMGKGGETRETGGEKDRKRERIPRLKTSLGSQRKSQPVSKSVTSRLC